MDILDKFKHTHKKTSQEIISLYNSNHTLTIKECIARIQWKKRIIIDREIRQALYKKYPRTIKNKIQ